MSVAYDEGWEVGYNCTDQGNPYDPDDPNYQEWENGYEDGSEEADEPDYENEGYDKEG